MNDPQIELGQLRERIDRMAGEVSVAIDRDFQYTIEPEEVFPALDKLRVLLNHLIVTARQTKNELAVENRRLQAKVEQMRVSSPTIAVPLTTDDRAAHGFSILAGTTHKLRELTASFIESTGRLKKCPTQTISRSVDSAKKEGVRLLRILHNLHDLAAIEAGELKPDRIPCSHIELLESIRRSLAPEVERKGLGLRVSYETAVPEVVWSDPTRLAQVLDCVISSSIREADSGEIQVRVRHDKEGNSPWLSFIVCGSAEGSSGARDAIEKMFQSAGRGEIGELGSGLEPVLACKFAALLGGSLTVVRGPETSFSLDVTIPGGNAEGSRQVEPAEALAGPDDISARFDRPLNCRILVAEDEPDTQKFLESVLNVAGARVELAADGKTAVDTVLEAELGDDPFDVVFLSLQMPEVDGLAASRELRRKGFDRTIIALTDRALKEEREESLEAGCDAFVASPYDASMLKLLVRSCVVARSNENAGL